MKCREYFKLYNNRRWRRKRLAQIHREPLCRQCLNRGEIKPAVDVDHVKPHKGDPDLFWHGQLQSLCKECHSVKTAQENGHGKTPVDVTGAPQGW